MNHPKVIGLAEFMNFPGVLGGDPGCLEKLSAFAGGHIDGHAPLVTGRNLDAYCAAGIRTDHEATRLDEATGVRIYDGAAAENKGKPGYPTSHDDAARYLGDPG